MSANRVLIEELRPTFATRTVDAWVEALLAARRSLRPDPRLRALARHGEHAKARAMVQEIAHPVEGSFHALGFPVKLTGTPQAVRYPPPLLGEHGAELRRELIERGLLPDEARG